MAVKPKKKWSGMPIRFGGAKIVLLAVTIALAAQLPDTSEAPVIDPTTVISGKRTPQELYLSSQGALKRVTDNLEVLFVDVRDPVEISIVGHPEHIDGIVPMMVFSTTFDEALGQYQLVENENFLVEMAALVAQSGLTKDAEIIITCGSGRRSAKAARALQDAGYSNVWHIVDGYPGDEEPGINKQNAWQLAGLPWSTTMDVWGSARRRTFGDTHLENAY